MAKITFSSKDFEKVIKVTPEIETKINLFGTPLEFFNKEEIGIEIFPNRPDLFSLTGYLQAFSSFLGKDTGLKKYKLNKPEKDYVVKVTNEVKGIRSFTACAIVKNLSLTDSKIKELVDLQEKLASTMGRNRKKIGIGVYPLDKIKLPITYTAKYPKEIKYQPLGIQKELTAPEILLLHPTGKKYEHLLKNSQKYPVFTDANKEIMSMPPIVNSEITGRVDVNTKEVFIECTGTDKNTVQKGLIIFTTALSQMGGKVYQMEIIDKEKTITPDFTPQKMKISLDNTNKLLGLSLTEQQLTNLLARMGHDYKKGVAEVGAWRADIMHEVDLIKDVAIAYGYDNFKPELPNLTTVGEESKESIIKRKISEVLIGLEMIELSSYHLIKQEEKEMYGVETLELEDSKTEYKFLRPNLLIPLLRILSENKDAEYPQKVFEIGRVFSSNKQKETGIEEKDNLVAGLTPSNFTDAKQHLDYIFKAINLKYTLKEFTHPELIEGRTGAIIVNNKSIGYIGEVHPLTLKKQGIKMPLAVIEISLEDILV